MFNAIYYPACQVKSQYFFVHLIIREARRNKSWGGENSTINRTVWYSNAQIENRVMNIFVRL